MFHLSTLVVTRILQFCISIKFQFSCIVKKPSTLPQAQEVGKSFIEIQPTGQKILNFKVLTLQWRMVTLLDLFVYLCVITRAVPRGTVGTFYIIFILKIKINLWKWKGTIISISFLVASEYGHIRGMHFSTIFGLVTRTSQVSFVKIEQVAKIIVLYFPSF